MQLWWDGKEEGPLERSERGPSTPVARSGLVSGECSSFAAALLEAVAVAVHLQDVHVVGSWSSWAPVRRSEPRTSVHSWKGRFEVIRIEPRS